MKDNGELNSTQINDVGGVWTPKSEKDSFLLTTNLDVRTCLDCIYRGFEIDSKLDTKQFDLI